MSVLTDVIANASSAAGVGLLLDQVFVGQSGQQKILSHLQKQNSSTDSLNVRLHATLLFIRNEIFRRTFGSKYFSQRYFVRSAYLSLSFIVIFAVYQNLSYGEVVDYLTENPYNVTIFTIFCVANLIIDYISIVQTNILLSFSVSSKKFASTCFLIFADIMSTMGIFKFAYSSFIFLFLLVSVELIQNAELKNKEITLTYSVTREGSEAPYEYDIGGVRVIPNNPDFNFLDVHLTSASEYIDPTRFNSFRIAESISIIDQSIESNGTKFRLTGDPSILLRGDKPISYTISYALSPPAIHLDGRTFANIFTQVASVDYNFLSVLNPALATVHVSDMLGINYGYNPFNDTQYCSMGPTGLVFNADYEVYFGIEDCPVVLTGHSGESHGDSTVYYDWDTSIIDLELPLTLFFASSFAPTLMIYAMAISLALMGAMSSKLIPIQSKIIQYWARAPFGIFGFMVGVLVSFL